MNIHSVVTTELMARRAAPPTWNKQDAILDAALRLFVERGFHGTAVPEVAEEAGVAAGTIYHYFDSKAALVNALYRREKEKVTRAIHASFPANATPRVQFAAIWREMSTFATENPQAFAFLELHHHGSYLDAQNLALDQSLRTFGVGFVRAAQTAGVLKTMDPRLMMELIFGAFIGVIRARWEQRAFVDGDALTAAEEACWDAIALHAVN
jgi:AcrR family transcriptional regulator